MKDIIIEAGRKLGKYLREELDGRVTQLNTKRLNAAATDLLPGDRYAHVRLFMERCERYHLLVKYAESDLERDARVGDIVHTLKEKELMTEESGRYCAALVIAICEGTPDAEIYAKSLFEVKAQSTPVTPTPVPQNTQPQMAQPQRPTQPIQPPRPPQNLRPNDPFEFKMDGSRLVKYIGNSDTVVIPNGVAVIGEEAFRDCECIKSVVIPCGVRKIGSSSFSWCKNLNSVVISEGVATISSYAFNGCVSLESIHIPASVTVIENWAFGNCEGLSLLTVAEGNKVYHSSGNCIINTSNKRLRVGCKNSIIPSDGSVTIIGKGAFSNCTEHVSIPNSVTKIEHQAFYGCTGLVSISIPNSVISIEKMAFSNCTGLASISIPNSVIRIEGDTFYRCSSLESVTIPDSVVFIGNSAFSKCTGIKSVDIPESVTEIGLWAFADCVELNEVRIRARNVNIGEGAFLRCGKLTIYKSGGLKLSEIFGTKWNPDRRPVKRL